MFIFYFQHSHKNCIIKFNIHETWREAISAQTLTVLLVWKRNNYFSLKKCWRSDTLFLSNLRCYIFITVFNTKLYILPTHTFIFPYDFCNKQWLRCSVTAESLRKPGFLPRPFSMRFVVHISTLVLIGFRLLLSVYFQYIHINYILLLPEVQMGEAWEPAKTQCPYPKSGNFGLKSNFTSFCLWT